MNFVCLGAAACFAAACSTPLTREPEAGRYVLYLSVDGEHDRIGVRGEWRLLPRSTPRAALDFYLTPLAQDFRLTARCAGRAARVVGLDSVEEGGDQRWRLTLAEPCARLSFAFSYALDGATAPQLRAGAREGFAGGGGELWYPQTEFATREVGEITLELPNEVTGVATGHRVATGTQAERHLSTYLVETPSKFAFAYGRYRTFRMQGATPVEILALSEGADPEALADVVSRAIAPLTSAFGPAPFGELRIVEIDFRSRVLGSSEAGMLFVDRSQIAAADLAYWAHEIAHQWWGVSVRARGGTPGAAMLTEGLSQYGALFTLEANDAAAASRFRLNGDGTSSDDSIQAYQALAAEHDAAPATFLPEGQSAVLFAHRLATSKGALALNLIAETAGRQRFHGVLRDFHARHAGRRATWAELQAALTAGLSEEARAMIGDWLDRPGAPALNCTVDGARIGLTQDAPRFRFPLTVLVQGEWGEWRERTWLDVGDETVLVAPGPIRRVEIDPENAVPLIRPVRCDLSP